MKAFEEIWKPVQGFEGLYEVSNMGRVRSVDKYDAIGRFYRGKVLSPKKGTGYLHVILWKERTQTSVYIHRLVAFAFPEICGEWFDGAQVNHKNEITSDNRAENIEWVPVSYNLTYGTRLNRITAKTKKRVAQIDLETKKTMKTYKSQSEAAKAVGCKQGGISNCCLGKANTAGGYGWRFII